jgi:hypothetical protein
VRQYFAELSHVSAHASAVSFFLMPLCYRVGAVPAVKKNKNQ